MRSTRLQASSKDLEVSVSSTKFFLKAAQAQGSTRYELEVAIGHGSQWWCLIMCVVVASQLSLPYEVKDSTAGKSSAQRLLSSLLTACGVHAVSVVKFNKKRKELRYTMDVAPADAKPAAASAADVGTSSGAGAASAASSGSSASARDWRAELGLTNSLMFTLCS